MNVFPHLPLEFVFHLRDQRSAARVAATYEQLGHHTVTDGCIVTVDIDPPARDCEA